MEAKDRESTALTREDIQRIATEAARAAVREHRGKRDDQPPPAAAADDEPAKPPIPRRTTVKAKAQRTDDEPTSETDESDKLVRALERAMGPVVKSMTDKLNRLERGGATNASPRRRAVTDVDLETDTSSDETDSVVPYSPRRTTAHVSAVVKLHNIMEIDFSQDDYTFQERLKASILEECKGGNAGIALNHLKSFMAWYADVKGFPAATRASEDFQPTMERGAKKVWQIRASAAHAAGIADYNGMIAGYDKSTAAFPTKEEFAAWIPKANKPARSNNGNGGKGGKGKGAADKSPKKGQGGAKGGSAQE
jgi:hypothetical protein